MTIVSVGGVRDVGDLTDWVTCAIFMILLLVLQLVLNNTVFVAGAHPPNHAITRSNPACFRKFWVVGSRNWLLATL